MKHFKFNSLQTAVYLLTICMPYFAAEASPDRVLRSQMNKSQEESRPQNSRLERESSEQRPSKFQSLQTSQNPNKTSSSDMRLSNEESPKRGGQGSGGGDPKAIRFVQFGKQVAAWLLTNPHPAIDIDPTTLLDHLTELEKSLDTKNPRIRFQPVDSISCFGAPKAGCTNSDLSIDIATKFWTAPSTTDKDRCTLTAMELFLQQIQIKRYEKAQSVCSVLSASVPAKMAAASANAPTPASALKAYIENYPKYQVEGISIQSKWHKIGGNQNASTKSWFWQTSHPDDDAKRSAREELIKNASSQYKHIIENGLTFELADACDLDAGSIKELWGESASESLPSKYFVGSAQSYSVYYQHSSYCHTDKKSKYVRAVVKASVALASSMDEMTLRYYISKSVSKILNKQSEAMDLFVLGLTSLRANPTLSYNRFSSFQVNRGEEMQNWLLNYIGQMKSAHAYARFVQNLKLGNETHIQIEALNVKIRAALQLLMSAGNEGIRLAFLDTDENNYQEITIATRIQLEDLFEALGQPKIQIGSSTGFVIPRNGREILTAIENKNCRQRFQNIKDIYRGTKISTRVVEMLKLGNASYANIKIEGVKLTALCKKTFREQRFEMPWEPASSSHMTELEGVAKFVDSLNLEKRNCYPTWVTKSDAREEYTIIASCTL